MRLRRSSLALAAALIVMTASSFAFAGKPDNVTGGPPGGLIYAHDQQFKTIGTPTDLPNHGKFDTIYVLGGMLANVAETAPGDMDFNGGRWEVRPITWLTISPTQFTNAEQIKAAEMAGQISIGGVVKRFECPMIPIH